MRKNAWYRKHIVKEKRKALCAVNIIESEAGWGQRVDDTIYFNDREAAMAYAVDYNAPNVADYAKTGRVPGWYMKAEVVSL